MLSGMLIPKMATPGEVLRRLRLKKGLKLREVGALADMAMATVSKKELGDLGIQAEDIEPLAAALEMAPEALKEQLERAGWDPFSGGGSTSDDPDGRPRGMIPLVNVVPAGSTGMYWETGPTTMDAPSYIDAAGLSGGNLFALRVVGDSMEPRIFEGDIVVIRSLERHADEHPTIPDKAIVFVRFTEEARRNECTLAQWSVTDEGKIRLTKANDSYRRWVIECSPDDLEQVGTLVERRTRRV